MNMPITVRLATKADIKQSLSSRCTADFEPAYDRCGSKPVFAVTGAIGTGATAPILYGIIGDALGVIPAVLIIAGLVLLTLPLSLVLRAFGQLTRGPLEGGQVRSRSG